MQNRQFDIHGFPQAAYGQTISYDNFSCKPPYYVHYADAGYDSYANRTLDARETPQTYTEDAFFNTGSAIASSYYKYPGRQIETSSYDNQCVDQPLPKSDAVSSYQNPENTDCEKTKMSDQLLVESGNIEDLVDHKPNVDDKVSDAAASSEQTDKTNDAVEVDEGAKEIKPTLSYIALIAKSILDSTEKRINLGSIYSWIEKHYPYYLNKGQGWRNSVRHNLSLNDCFIKAGRCEDGKGNYWAIHPANVQDFMRGDFRQRRRSRKRGRKREGDFGLLTVPNNFLPGVNPAHGAGLSCTNHSIAPIYSPYTEAERRAYKLDEAMLRHSMTNSFMRWYPNYTDADGTNCNTAMYGNPSEQCWQPYSESTHVQNVYQPFQR